MSFWTSSGAGSRRRCPIWRYITEKTLVGKRIKIVFVIFRRRRSVQKFNVASTSGRRGRSLIRISFRWKNVSSIVTFQILESSEMQQKWFVTLNEKCCLLGVDRPDWFDPSEGGWGDCGEFPTHPALHSGEPWPCSHTSISFGNNCRSRSWKPWKTMQITS